jgi:RNA polymerase sigma factor (sigma-70 family)
MTTATLDHLARQAVSGDRQALEGLINELQSDVYGVAIRMLWNREDAEDATQEILVRVVTRLVQFDFRSRLRTWVYRIAVNYILNVKKSPVERMNMTFERFAEDLADGLSDDGPAAAEESVLVEESRSDARWRCCSAWTGHIASRTSSARYSSWLALMPQKRSTSVPGSFENGFNMRGRPSPRSRASTVD